MPNITVSTYASKDVQVKTVAVARTNTAGTDVAFVLPRFARILGFVLSGTASDAGTTATLSIGTTSGTPVEYVNAQSVLAAGAGNGVNLLKGVTGAVGVSLLTADTIVYFKYAETGGASTVGSWQLSVLYTTGGVPQAAF